MASTGKSVSMAERTGRRAKEEMGVVEIDATFGRVLGLADGQKVRTLQPSRVDDAKFRLQVEVLLHLDPPLAHTVHIEPLTPADWESE